METEMVAETGMLIRKPVTEVFDAVFNPEVTTRFWFTRSTGKLEAGRRVRWQWEMLGHSADIDVDVVETNQRIVYRWPSYKGDGQTTVEWRFTTRPDGTTFVNVVNSGFRGDPGAVARDAAGAGQGFTLVLAGMKAWLEHQLELNLIRDRFPQDVEH
jgi:uncharacterized protein YndB with AHSA1/START domain